MSTSTPKVWFAIPTANPAAAARNLPRWRAMGYRVAVLQDRRRFPVPEADLVFTPSTEYLGWGTSVSLLSRMLVIAGADIVVTGGDDMQPDPRHRAEEIGRQFIEHFGGTLGVMQPTGDDMPGVDRICGSPWLGRQWIIDGYGGMGPVPTCYRHFYADEELKLVAERQGKLWMRPDLVQHHEHWSRTGQRHEVAEVLQTYWAEDQGTFINRQMCGFPGSMLQKRA
ncbi:MAG TPA: hypothetical protein VK176_16340 [Phycisphaerales bacterium]|nr:hypothetical protein [Phycisphaerales bacterium]